MVSKLQVFRQIRSAIHGAAWAIDYRFDHCFGPVIEPSPEVEHLADTAKHLKQATHKINADIQQHIYRYASE
ncbi:MAG: hypothetical protein EOO38_15540 [Cytophagaceae bacterium]|nr:MAG: hypothetical protein EOO38_15540 [Cytophagaceae bacterium]